jgi:hypothetical protein
LSHEVRVDLNFRRSKGRSGDEFEVCVSDELAGEPEERSLEVVVGLGRDFEVLKVLLSVEGDSSGLYFSLLQFRKSQKRKIETT